MLAGFVGATGVGKSTLTYKLQKMGYYVHFEGFVEMYVRQPACAACVARASAQGDRGRGARLAGGGIYFPGPGRCAENPSYPPTSALLTLKWTHRLLGAIEGAREAHARGELKGGIAFFDRSFLTPAMYAPSPPATRLHQPAPVRAPLTAARRLATPADSPSRHSCCS